MRHNNCVTKKYAHISTQTDQLRTCYALCIADACSHICLRSRQLKQLPKLFELFVKHNSNIFVFYLKQFSEITIVRKHKHV